MYAFEFLLHNEPAETFLFAEQSTDNKYYYFTLCTLSYAAGPSKSEITETGEIYTSLTSLRFSQLQTRSCRSLEGAAPVTTHTRPGGYSGMGACRQSTVDAFSTTIGFSRIYYSRK